MIFFGKVVDINDTKKLGRAKVIVYDLHDNIETKDLSWSMALMPANTPAQFGHGQSVNLQIGTLVVGIFLDSAQQEFLIQGSLPTKTDGVEDNNVRVRGEADPNAGEPAGGYQPVSGYQPVYPYNNVMETESGHVKEYDDTPSHERIMERHMSGTQYEIIANGSKNETIVRDNYRLVVGHDTLEVYGDVRIIVSGHADIAVGGNLTTSVTGNIAADAFGDITLKTNDTTKRVVLDANVLVKGNLTVNETTTTSAQSSSRTPVLLDGHDHDETHSPITQTGIPN
jgi:hypothetical protein